MLFNALDHYTVKNIVSRKMVKFRYFNEITSGDHNDFLYECALHAPVPLFDLLYFWGVQSAFVLSIICGLLLELTNLYLIEVKKRFINARLFFYYFVSTCKWSTSGISLNPINVKFIKLVQQDKEASY